jgi:hypothetical protein
MKRTQRRRSRVRWLYPSRGVGFTRRYTATPVATRASRSSPFLSRTFPLDPIPFTHMTCFPRSISRVESHVPTVAFFTRTTPFTSSPSRVKTSSRVPGLRHSSEYRPASQPPCLPARFRGPRLRFRKPLEARESRGWIGSHERSRFAIAHLSA